MSRGILWRGRELVWSYLFKFLFFHGEGKSGSGCYTVYLSSNIMLSSTGSLSEIQETSH